MTTTATVTSGSSWTVPAGISKVDVVAFGRMGYPGSKVGGGTPGARGYGAKVTKRGVAVSGTVAFDLNRVSVGSFLFAGCGGQGGDSGDYNGGAGGSIDPATGKGLAGSPSGGGSGGGGGGDGATGGAAGSASTPGTAGTNAASGGHGGPGGLAGGVRGGEGGSGYAGGGGGGVNTGANGGGGGGAGSSYGYDEIAVSANANPSVNFTYASAPFVPTNLAANGGGNVLVEAATVLTWLHMPATADTLDGQAAYQVRYRVIGAGSWTELTKVTSATASAIVAANTFTADDFEWQVKTFADGLAGPYSDSAYFTARASILAPTNLSPDNGDTIDISDPLTISWLHNTIGGAPQTGFDLRYDTVPTSGAWTTVSDHATATMSKVFASATFSAADYKYQVCTYISGGGPGPWSAEATFTGVNNVPAPVITAPASLDVITGATFAAEWTFSDQQGYEAQMLPDVGGTPDTAHPYSATGPVTSVAQSLTLTAPADGVTVWLRIRCQDSSDVWSPWSQVKISVAWAKPAKPSVLLAIGASWITATVVNPTPTGDEPTVDQVEIWVHEGDAAAERRAVLDPGDTWTYQVPPAETDIGVEAFAVFTPTGTKTTSGVIY